MASAISNHNRKDVYMVKTQDFRTRTEFKPVVNPNLEGITIIAIDMGYSGVKTVSEAGAMSVPYYAKDLGINPEITSASMRPEDILYRNSVSKHIWRVGKSAQELVGQSDTNDTNGELVARYRYQTEMFQILLETNIGLALIHNGYRKPEDLKTNIVIQTGLPPAYLEEDAELLKDAFVGKHKFAVKTQETGVYIQFEFELTSGNVEVMSQPKGTLMSLIVDDKGCPNEYIGIFEDNGVIIDIGYGTLDKFEFKGGTVTSKESFKAYSMEAVLKRTADKIKEKYGVNLRASAMQNCLETGTVKVCKRIKGMPPVSKNEDFTELLQEANKEVCMEAMEKILNTCDVTDYKFMVITGGTAAAWENYIREYFSGIEGLRILRGDENANIGMTYANVRGYYFQQYLKQLKRRNKVA